MQDSAFDGLVSGFYRAATGQTDWNAALLGVQQAFGARAALLQTIDMRSGRILALRGGGPQIDEAVLNYVREYHLIDPRRQYALARGDRGFGQWAHCHEQFDDDFVARDPFYQHYLPAYETRYNANVTFAIEPEVMAGFILELPAARGVLNADERESARRLGLHLQDALRAWQRVRALAAQALAGHTLLSNFAYPMWLIDSERFIHYANAAAGHQTDAATRIARRGSHLVLVRNGSDLLLTQTLQRLRAAAHGTNTVIEMRLSGADAPTWLHLSLLIPNAALGAFGELPMILCTLFDPQQVDALDPFALAAVLKLTPAQAKVAARLADGLTAQQIALAHGTSVATVRSHVRSVLRRLGARRVADVVRMLRQGQPLWARAEPLKPD